MAPAPKAAPRADTVKKVYDHLDFSRGVEVFLNLIPAASLEGLRTGLAELGATKSNQCVIWDELMDSETLLLTANTETVYVFMTLDLERDGAIVVEIPPHCGPALVDDAYFRFVTDMGPPGPDGGAGGKYLILPPDYQGDLDPPVGSMEAEVQGEKYFVSKSTSYTNLLALRGFLVDGKPDTAAAMFRQGLKVYPLAEASNPPAMEFISGSHRVFNTIHANDFEFYEEIWQVIQKEPVDFLDPELRGLAAAIGIRKGQPFEPDARMKEILTEAVAVGNATARAILLRPRNPEAYYYQNSGWCAAFVGGDYRWLIDDGVGGRDMDARTQMYYMATGNTPAMGGKMIGRGSQYIINGIDKDGNYLDGRKSYRLNVPKDVPAVDFWSLVVYDPQTRSELQTSQEFPGKNNQRGIDVNGDGSVDLYFGPEPPAGKENNWIATVPGKGWFAMFRIYSPLEPWFDKTWQVGEFELVE
jgi:hypothetical protein